MATLRVASKANQAVTLPVVLVAMYAQNVNPKATIEVTYEDADKLPGEGTFVVDYKSASGPTISGEELVLEKLLEDNFPPQPPTHLPVSGDGLDPSVEIR